CALPICAARTHGLEREQCEHLVFRVAHVYTLCRGQTVRYPVQPVQRHYVIQPHHRGVTELVAQRRREVRVAVRAQRVPGHGREPPILTATDARVGGCTGGRSGPEYRAVPPGVIAGRSHAERHAGVAVGWFGARGDRAELPRACPLHKGVVTETRWVEVTVADASVAQPRGPLVPAGPQRVDDSAEARVLDHVRTRSERLRVRVAVRSEQTVC